MWCGTAPAHRLYMQVAVEVVASIVMVCVAFVEV
jgi:hypothetical protein